jgi:hypothetical protein
MVYLLYVGDKNGGTARVHSVYEEECFAIDTGIYLQAMGQIGYYYVEKQPLIRGEYV